MRYLIRLTAVVFLTLLWAMPVFAQGSFVLTDPDDWLNPDTIEDAARPLINQGAEVAVYFVANGDGDDFQDRLIEDGLARDDGLVRTNMIAIYVALDDRYSSIRFGDGWQEALGVNDNYNLIREQVLNEGLSSGDYTPAISNTLDAINQAIISPPSPNGSINVDTTPFVYGGLGLAAAAAGGWAVTQNRRNARIRATAEQKLKEAREGAGTLIAQLGQRFRLASEKAQFDKVSYSPNEVQRITAAQATVQQKFAAVQTSFDDVGEQFERYEKPTLEQMAQATSAYEQVTQQAAVVGQELAQVEQIRSELDELARQAPGEIDRAKKA